MWNYDDEDFTCRCGRVVKVRNVWDAAVARGTEVLLCWHNPWDICGDCPACSHMAGRVNIGEQCDHVPICGRCTKDLVKATNVVGRCAVMD